MLNAADRRRSLEDLEGDRWGDPPAGSSRLVRVVHQLRRKPIAELTIEDLRVLVGQQVSLHRLVPLAIDRLREDPLVAGDLYEGDLLAAVLRVDSDFWKRHPALAEDVHVILGPLGDLPDDLAAAAARFRGGV
jgi:hypothetical protein